MKETVAVASCAVLLLSDLGQSHLLLGKSHVQKNGVNGCESERARWWWCLGECGDGMELEREGESEEEMDEGGRKDVREAVGGRSVLWGNRERGKQQKKKKRKGKKARNRGVKCTE